MNKNRMNLRIFDNDVNIIDRTGAESLIPTQEANEIIQGTITQSAVLSRGRKLANMTSRQYKMPVLDMLPIAYFVNGDAGQKKTTSDMVKDAVCAVADVYCSYDQKQASAGMVKSENNDGYSVTYVTEQTDGQTAEEVLRKKAYAAASAYLLPTGWLSRKVGCCYVGECNDYNL